MCAIASTPTNPRHVGLREGYFYDDLVVGQSVGRSFKVTAEKIAAFAEIIEDHNPLHFSEEYTKNTLFGSSIAHGNLISGFISATLAHHLPGPGWAPTNISLKFRAPVYAGDDVRVEIKLVDKVELRRLGRRLNFSITCSVGDKRVVTAEATLADVRTYKSINK